MFTVAEILDATGGVLCAGRPEERVTGVSTDSRTIRPGDLFVALVGKHHDGHAYVREACRKGAAGALITSSRFSGEIPFGKCLIAVGDTLFAFQEIARFHRGRSDIPVVAVTGSNGKTTTKEMIASIVSLSCPCLKSEGNINNQVGVPHTLLRLSPEHRAAVIEVGISQAGEMARLSQIIRPTVGVITNIGPAHLESLGSVEGVAEEKGVLLTFLSTEGIAVLNRDDPLYTTLVKKVTGSLVTFGMGEKADVRAESVLVTPAEGTSFILSLRRNEAGVTPGAERERIQIHLPFCGRHHIYNALAASAVALSLGVDRATMRKALEQCVPLPMRGEIITWRGLRVINDAYNANPASVASALTMVAEIKRSRAFALLGDMLELGEAACHLHREIGRRAAEEGIDVLLLMGRWAESVAEGARLGGMKDEMIRICRDHHEMQEVLLRIAQPEDLVLLKGSRAMQMERVLE